MRIENMEYGIKILEKYQGKEITSEELSEISESIDKNLSDDKNIAKELNRKKKKNWTT